MKMSWLPYKGWLLFDENYLLLGCNYLSDYSPGMFLSKHLEAPRRLTSTCGFRSGATVRLNIHCLLVAYCFFNKAQYWLRLAPVLCCGGKCPIGSRTLCKCFCSSDAVHAQSSIFSRFQSGARPHRRYTLLFWPGDSGIANKAIFMF